MSALDSALSSLLAHVDEDHHRVAAALLGVEGPAPVDPDLAALHTAVLEAGRGVSLLDLAEAHPDAVARQISWATGAWDPTATTDAPAVTSEVLTVDLTLSLAS